MNLTYETETKELSEVMIVLEYLSDCRHYYTMEGIVE